MPDTVPCPACGKAIAVKGIPKHTNGCPKWAEVIGVPPSEFNFDRHFKRGLYAEGAVEGEDFVRCSLCGAPGHRAKRLADHLKLVHALTVSEYGVRFPDSLTSARGSQKQREATVLGPLRARESLRGRIGESLYPGDNGGAAWGSESAAGTGDSGTHIGDDPGASWVGVCLHSSRVP